MSRECSGRVDALYIFEEKGKPGRRIRTAEIVAGKGVRGDFHFEDVDAPVSIAAVSAGEWMLRQSVQGLCFRRFKANMWIDIPKDELGTIKKGMQLVCKGIVLEIKKGKGRCFAECERVKRGLPCLLREGCWYAVSVSGGSICEGERVKIRQKNNE